MPEYTVGSRQAEHELYRESIKEDNIVIRVGNSLKKEKERQTDRGGRAVSLRDYKEVPRPS